jgi:predicted RNA binding protein with dsRBD fold (UPF0201 family)
VSNAIDEAARVTHAMRALFPVTLRIDVRGYDNRIVVGCARTRSGSWLRQAVRRDPILAPSAPVLSFRGPLR